MSCRIQRRCRVVFGETECEIRGVRRAAVERAVDDYFAFRDIPNNRLRGDLPILRGMHTWTEHRRLPQRHLEATKDNSVEAVGFDGDYSCNDVPRPETSAIALNSKIDPILG